MGPCGNLCTVAAPPDNRLAAEWANRGVRVNSISPGIVDTALIRVRMWRPMLLLGTPPGFPQDSPDLAPLVQEWLAQIPAGRLADVGDVQAAAVYLASGAAGYVTGHNLIIEGGQSLW